MRAPLILQNNFQHCTIVCKSCRRNCSLITLLLLIEPIYIYIYIYIYVYVYIYIELTKCFGLRTESDYRSISVHTSHVKLKIYKIYER